MFAVLCNLSQGTQSILEEESHIKDVLSRIVVEMIKREWPQHWPDMLKELDTLSKQGVRNTAVQSLLLARSMGFSLPSSWGKCNSLMVKWDRLVMDSEIPVRLSYPEMTLAERGPSCLFIFSTCDLCLHACFLSFHIFELEILMFGLCWWSVFHFGASGNSDRTGDVHPPTFGRGCGDFSNSTYPAATRYPANPHPEHGKDLQLPTNCPAAERQQVQMHGKTLLPLGLVCAGGI